MKCRSPVTEGTHRGIQPSFLLDPPAAVLSSRYRLLRAGISSGSLATSFHTERLLILIRPVQCADHLFAWSVWTCYRLPNGWRSLRLEISAGLLSSVWSGCHRQSHLYREIAINNTHKNTVSHIISIECSLIFIPPKSQYPESRVVESSIYDRYGMRISYCD